VLRAGPLRKKTEASPNQKEAVQRSWAAYFVALRGSYLVFYRDQKQVRRARARAPAVRPGSHAGRGRAGVSAVRRRRRSPRRRWAPSTCSTRR